MTNLDYGGDQIKRKSICSVILLLAFVLILNVNATSAATINGTSSTNSSIKADISSNMTSQTNTISASSSKSSTNTINKLTTAKAVSTTVDKTKPKVISTYPVNNAVKVHNYKNIIIKFNESIKFGNHWVELRNNGKNIPIKTWINGNTLNIDPIKLLTRGMVYSIILHTNSITDMSGNKLSLYKTKFSTIPAKKQISAAPLKYLQPSSNCQSSNPTIKALAKSITAGSTSDYSRASKIFNWVKNHISYSFYYNSKYGALGTLKSRTANCADTAHLMVALERAAGIPARYNHGSCQFTSGTWYGHVWAQVYVNGKWYYADGTSYRNSFGVIKNWNTKTFTLHGIYASLPF